MKHFLLCFFFFFFGRKKHFLFTMKQWKDQKKGRNEVQSKKMAKGYYHCLWNKSTIVATNEDGERQSCLWSKERKHRCLLHELGLSCNRQRCVHSIMNLKKNYVLYYIWVKREFLSINIGHFYKQTKVTLKNLSYNMLFV